MNSKTSFKSQELKSINIYPENIVFKSYGTEFFKKLYLNATVECWKKALPEEQFNDLILDYFRFYQKEGKKEKTRINTSHSEFVLLN